MSLASGTRLGPCEVLGLIGAGGMGEVCKARDTRLDRTVAVTVLPAELNADPERRAHFEREAKTIASLTHPHICALYDVGEAVPSGPESRASSSAREPTLSEPRERRVEGQPLAPVHYLVMEHPEGQTLADRLRKGPLPLAQAVDLGAQIADALDAAHKHGIIHRDLKPGNVMLTTGGAGRSGVTMAKLLDFGLAKLAAHGGRPAVVAEGATAPTMAAPFTARGTILGTLQYMAPEQLEGQEADARTDLWALGALLYEMVTGRRAFESESQVSLIGAILNTEPAPLLSLQPVTPPALDRLVRKCLAKHPDDRWDSAHDVADELRWLRETSALSAATPAGPHRHLRTWGAALAAGLLAGAAIGAGVMNLRRPPAEAGPGVLRAMVSVAPAERLQSNRLDVTMGEQRPSQMAIALSPDGRLIVFSGVKGDQQQLYLRAVDRFDAVPIEGTEGGSSPFFAPDGKWIGFWANDALRKIPVAGGPPTTICETKDMPVTPVEGQTDVPDRIF